MQRRKVLKNGLLGALAFPIISKPMSNNKEIDLTDILMQRYPGIRRNIKSSVYDQLSEEELRKRPADMNSIAWNLWHMARAEDVGLNCLVTEKEQVFDRDNWMTEMNIDIRHFGTGMTKAEVEKLSDEINIEALKEYHNAVGTQTEKIFAGINTVNLDEKLDPKYLNSVMIGQGVLHEKALWVEEFYQTKKRSWFLIHMGLTHSFEHLGQIMIIRKLLGYSGSR
ncbi:MAG: DinB family protein [Bacteroidota bacterium]